MAGQLSAPPIDLDSSVRSKFTVKDSFHLPDGEMEFSIVYRPDSKERFVELSQEFAASGFTPRLVGGKENALLFVRKTQTVGRQRSRVPVILALLALGSVVVFGLYSGFVVYPMYAPSIPGGVVILLYGAVVIAVLAAHELGHTYFSRRKDETPPAPYLLPGVLGVTMALPTLGIISRQRGPAVNRDRFFDVMLAGPLLGLAVSMALYVLGAVVAVQSAVPLQSCQQVNGTAVLCPSVIQLGLDAVIGPFLPHVASGYSALSPLADGATVGLILTFVGLLPMASFDGGHLSSLAWGPGASRIATYLSVILLISVDPPTYWALAVVVLLLMSSSRNSEPQLLDEVSPVSVTRRWLYLGAVVLALLCMPLPQTIAGFPLR
jgi:membrane-associated protease RseP (regulator of RpoE activity)